MPLRPPHTLKQSPLTWVAMSGFRNIFTAGRPMKMATTAGKSTLVALTAGITLMLTGCGLTQSVSDGTVADALGQPTTGQHQCDAGCQCHQGGFTSGSRHLHRSPCGEYVPEPAHSDPG